MNKETTFVIAYYKRHPEFKEAIKTIPETSEKTRYMKLNLDLSEDTELIQVQCDLFYAAISNVEWDIVIRELEILK